MEWPRLPIRMLVATAQGTCLAMASRAFAATGKTRPQVGYSEFVNNDVRGSTLPFDYYSCHKLTDREKRLIEQEVVDAEHIAALRKLFGNILTVSQLARTESYWYQFGSAGDRMDRIAVVTTDPTAWRASRSAQRSGL